MSEAQEAAFKKNVYFTKFQIPRSEKGVCVNEGGVGAVKELVYNGTHCSLSLKIEVFSYCIRYLMLIFNYVILGEFRICVWIYDTSLFILDYFAKLLNKQSQKKGSNFVNFFLWKT